MRNRNKKNKIIKVDTELSQPIYKQIIYSIQKAIKEEELALGDILPSVNQVAAEASIARGSIFKAYNELRASGVIESIPGKGYYITSTNYKTQRNIFLLLSTFNPYREILYNAFINRIGNHATVDIYFHHHNIEVFETLITNHSAKYNTFVVMPELHNRTNFILKQLDQKQLYILDTGINEFGKQYPSVCQNYEKDIFTFLHNYRERLSKYKRVLLLFPDNIRAYDIIPGFQEFFRNFKMPSQVVRKTADFQYQKDDFYVVMDDKDLVRLIHFAQDQQWQLGKDLGVVSYNETPLKSVVANGITTISTDFNKMGASMADMILANERSHIENPFLVIDRNSF